MIEYLVDTNVLSKVFKGAPAVTTFVEQIDCAIDPTIYIECIQGSKSNQEKRTIEKYLMRFPLLSLTSSSSLIAIDLIRRYSNSHGLLLADALIAATALENELILVTYNVDDFKFIDNLGYLKPSV